jgi:flagellar basal-body rod protein FlgB
LRLSTRTINVRAVILNNASRLRGLPPAAAIASLLFAFDRPPVLKSLTHSDGIPALERLMQFTGQRHRLIVNNVANPSTPGFRPADVSPETFQRQLGEAIDAKRAGRANAAGAIVGNGLFDDAPAAGGVGAGRTLDLRSNKEIDVTADRMILHPQPVSDNVLFHDGNDRSVERIMQDLVENFMTYRMAAQFLRSRLDQISTAIRERV